MKPLSLASMLLVSTAIAPAAFAQAAETALPQDRQDAAAEAQAAPEVSIPGGGNDIIVTGRAERNVVRAAPQVISVLSSADIARTGEGDIAGALQRVTGLSVVGSGFVYVRGLGDRYSLALLNGSPLPSPEPLKRVVPLDIFPTDVIASSLVQKSYSVNFPGEFGGGVINLTTSAVPKKAFLKISGSVGYDTETTGRLGYVYYGSPTDWLGYDDGTRDVPDALRNAFNSGKRIDPPEFTDAELSALATTLVNARTTVLQKDHDIPVNFSGDFSAGGSIDIGSTRLGFIAAAGLSNKWRTRETLQQLSLNADLSGTPQTSYDRVVTDNRVVVNGLLGLGLEFGPHKLRWTNLYIHDTLKQGSLKVGTDENQSGRDLLFQNTGWYERQLIDTQFVGELRFGDLGVDLRGGYANTKRKAPYEREFNYIRTNLPTTLDPTGDRFVTNLSSVGGASIAFSDLNEDLWSGGVDLTYPLLSNVKLGVGYAYSDTTRDSFRREFQFRAPNGLPLAVTQLRPDYLLSDYTVVTNGIILQEINNQDGTNAFNAKLRVHAGYGQVIADVTPDINVTAGVRYESGNQSVSTIDLYNSGTTGQFNTGIKKNYWLPALTATFKISPRMQVRASGSRTLARPQFRELIRQLYLDVDSNRLFQGNPSLVDSKLWNAEARFEWFFAPEQRITAAGFYKKIDKPIEAYSSILSSEVTTSFANAPSADLWGIELEGQKHFELSDWMGGDFWSSRRLVLIANYTFTQSKLKVGSSDTTVIAGSVLPASIFFKDGAPLTGQSDHLVNLQIGLEDSGHLSQQTLLLSYASDRVTSRAGVPNQPDVKERPGIQLDFVARQGVNVFGLETELKLEARNLTGTKYQEFQQSGSNRIYYNKYNVGRSFTLGLGLKF